MTVTNTVKPMRVQTLVERSGKAYLSSRSYSTVSDGLKELRVRARKQMLNWGADSPILLESDNNTYVRVKRGSAKRTFSLVTKREGEPIPFGHLVDPTRNILDLR